MQITINPAQQFFNDKIKVNAGKNELGASFLVTL
jgi:hypothetical protein